MYNRTVLLSIGLAATLTQAAQIDIAVGKDGSLKFDPDSSTAAQGDVLAFHFYQGGHSVVTGSFDSPCVPGTDAVFSGYMKGDDAGDMTYLVTVNNTDPIWYYCSLADHCEEGMVGVVNPPSDHKQSDFANAAKAVSTASAPAMAQGGMSTSLPPGSMASMAMTTTSASMSSSASARAASATSNAAPTASAFLAIAGAAGGLAALLL